MNAGACRKSSSQKNINPRAPTFTQSPSTSRIRRYPTGKSKGGGQRVGIEHHTKDDNNSCTLDSSLDDFKSGPELN